VSDSRRPSLRPVLLAVLLLLGLVEVQGVVQTVRAQTRLRERVIRSHESPVVATWPELARILRPGGADAWQRGLEEVLSRSTASEAELFDAQGQLVQAHPGPAPVAHWPAPSSLGPILAGAITTWGPVAGDQSRLLTYAAFPSGDRTLVLRLAGAVPELVQDLKERRGLLVGHGLVLVLIAIAAGLVLMPGAPALPSSHGVEAYAEALSRLRELGRNLSEQHQVERDRLTGEMRDLEAMARAGELTAGMAHEVRNGLGTILGYARLIEQKAAPGTTEPAQRILEECETLEVVVRRFMAFVKLEVLHPAAFDLHVMLRRVVARESTSHPVAGVDLRGPDAVPFVGDEEMLERAFENLVRNACEAAGPSGHVRVDVETAGADDVRVTIRDDGPGWSTKADAFRPFASTKAGGLGLGLPLARKLARLHGGDVLIRDSDRGAQVEVHLAGSPASPSRSES
jgi:signal transduction histidine kinase